MKKKLISVGVASGLMIVIIGCLGVNKLIEHYTSTNEKQDLYTYFEIQDENEAIISLQNNRLEERAEIVDGEIFVPYELVKDNFNSRFYWDESASLMVFTTATEIYKIPLESKNYTVNGEERTEEFIILKTIEDGLYLNIDFAKQYSDFYYEYYQEPNRIMVYNEWGNVDYTTLSKDGKIRVLGGIKSPILAELEKGTRVLVKDLMENWAHVQTIDGIDGYIQLEYLGDSQIVTLENPDYIEPVYPNIQKDYKINMAWHQVGGYIGADGFQQAMQGVSGVNTIAPTWFFMSDNDGNIVSYATHEYVQKAHEMGIEVWGLVQNMDYDISSYQILSRMASRENLVNQLISKALEYDLDGINVDIEELSNDAEDGYIQFIRELSIQCRKHGLVLSIDNYVPTAFTSHYNRKEQGIVADYIVIMGYDEHYAGVAEAGSTASIEFVKNGIIKTLEEVPKEKVINGIPFYTRVFKQIPENVAKEGQEGVLIEDTNSELGRYLLDSEAVPMGKAERLLQENGVNPIWNDALGQYYGEYMKDGIKYLIWLEEEESIGLKMKLIKDYELAGVAEWSLGLAKNTIWEVIRSYLE